MSNTGDDPALTEASAMEDGTDASESVFVLSVSQAEMPEFIESVLHETSFEEVSTSDKDTLSRETGRCWPVTTETEEMDSGTLLLFVTNEHLIGYAILEVVIEDESSKLLILDSFEPLGCPIDQLESNGVPNVEFLRAGTGEVTRSVVELYQNEYGSFHEFLSILSLRNIDSFDEIQLSDAQTTCKWIDQDQFESGLPENTGLSSGYLTINSEANAARHIETLQSDDLLVFHSGDTITAIGVVAVSPVEVVVDDNPQFVLWFSYLEFEETYSPTDLFQLFSHTNVDFTNIPYTGSIRQGAIKRGQAEIAKALIDDAADDSNISFLRDRTAETITNFEFEIPSDLYFPEEADDIQKQINTAINTQKHIIFTGPPGTGKTRLAEDLSRYASQTYADIVDDYIFTTASADWTAFDTVGGYSPNTDGSSLDFRPGQVLQCFRKNGDLRNTWLVIDELNRADIDKAMGGLFSVLAGQEVELPYERTDSSTPIQVIPLSLESVSADGSIDDWGMYELAENQDLYPVLPSWRLIATMNTSDKASLYELSYAFMRRFTFIHIGVPTLETDDGYITDHLDPTESGNYTEQLSDEVNETLGEDDLYASLSVIWGRLNEERAIGPSIVIDMAEFIHHYDDGDVTTDAVTDAVISQVFPQLEGLRQRALEELLETLPEAAEDESGDDIQIPLNESRLEKKAVDFFGVEFESNVE